METRVLLSATGGLAFPGNGPVAEGQGNMNPLTAIPELDSLPGAPVSIYLDFDGHTETHQSWTEGGPDIITPVFDIDDDASTFSDEELRRMEEIWYLVAEDFAPFDINVTTVDPGTYNNFETILVSIGGNGSWFGPFGGVAFLNAFSNDASNTAYVFSDNQGNGDAKYTALTVSHEAGHTFGLEHHSVFDSSGTKTEEYDPGTAELGPIMGAPFDSIRETWNDGPSSSGANILQDDLAVLTGSQNRTVNYRTDDHGDNRENATALPGGIENPTASGIIEQNTDSDFFRFDTNEGQITFDVSTLDVSERFSGNTTTQGTNLDVILTLYDDQGTVIASANPTESLEASISADVATGTYYVEVGKTDEYGALGQYDISGTVNPFAAVPTLLAPSGQVSVRQPEFAWTVAADAESYELEVLASPGGELIHSISGVTSTTYTSDVALAEGDYTARVRALNSEGELSDWSVSIAFTIDIPIPAAPAVIAPAGTIQDLTPIAEWTSVEFAQTYNLQVLDSSGEVIVATTGISTTTYQLPELEQGTYRIQVQAVNEIGELSPFGLSPSFVIDIPVPPKPEVLAPTGDILSDSQPEFQWTTEDAATSTLWVGKLREGTGTAQVQAIYDRIIYVTNHIRGSYTWFSQLPGEGTYAVWARNFNALGERGPWSSPKFFSLDVPTPTTPVLETIDTTHNLRPTIEWNAQEYAHTYDLWVNNLTTGQGAYIRERSLTDVNSFTPDEDLPQGRYRAWIRAANSIGEQSEWSQSITFDVDVLTPGQPTLIGPTTDATPISPIIGDGQGSTSTADISTPNPTFVWTDVVSAATYELWVNHVESKTSRIVHERALTTSEFTSTTDLPQGTYRAWVRAFNIAGDAGPWSEVYLFSLNIPTPSKPTITGPDTNAVGTVIDATPTITWTASTGDIDTYDLQLENLNNAQRVIDIGGISSTSYTSSITLEETSHRVRVRGVNSVDEPGEWSDWFSFTVDVPNATTPVTFSPSGTLTQSTVNFEWRHTEGNVQYEVFVRDLLKQESIVLRMTTSELSLGTDNAIYTADEFEDGTYRWWVRAFNSQGTASGWSSARTFNISTQTSIEQNDRLLPDELTTEIVSLEAPAFSKDTTANKQQVLLADNVVSQDHRTRTDIEQGLDNEESDLREVADVMKELANPESRLLLIDRVPSV